ncbi:oligopeptidase A [Pelagibaculum spongiae]|uniref:oligopeptidase A n=1 Tax=Pelagibaculum spongiae TaxID=2080658 RepID=A0A2V1GWV2_9GAMM|nr:oligopeptidase A [Pelagibaculum spongiae]PVZ68418.1 oligopeptidase A [Pelagibaculum spongiae]
MTTENPLLTSAVLPPFSQITTDQIEPAITQLIEQSRSKVAELLANPQLSWDGLMAPLEAMDDQLEQAWSPVSHMNSVVNSEDLRNAYNACLPKLSAWGTEMGQNRALFEAIQAIADSAEFATLGQSQKKVIENSLRDFRLSGVALDEQKRQRFGDIQTKLSELSSKFSENTLDATMAWSKLVEDEAELAGIPDNAKAQMAASAEEKGQKGWRLTLDIPCFLPVMTYCDNRELRHEISRAFVTRASEISVTGSEKDNSEIMAQLLELKHEKAQLLGFDNYAQLSVETKMADTPEQVIEFLTDLAGKTRSQAEKEMAELADWANTNHGAGELASWDIAYYGEKLKQDKYAISQEAVRPWFPANKVLNGLFEITHKLFGMTVTEVQGTDTWNDAVQFFEIKDSSGQLRGSFYLDLYAREHKRGGAWMDVCRNRRSTESGLQNPVAYLTCNFTRPVGDQPALLTHDEVTTLFHEFGHGIHHMLTQVTAAGVAGINGVAWDAVELPSQFMENFCWDPEGLKIISGHFETGDALPTEMLEKMLAAKNFQSAMGMARQIEFSLFDMRIHKEFDPAQGARIQQILDQVRAQIAVVPVAEFNRFQHSFGHIFGGGYAAGYYSYKWAEVLSADAFSRFEEEGVFNPQVGKDFLNCILEKGGSQPPQELFEAFRGRQPSIDALLRHTGIAA